MAERTGKRDEAANTLIRRKRPTLTTTGLFPFLKPVDQFVENLSIGLGHGITNQLQGLYDLAAHPVQSANALLDVGKTAIQDPRQFGQMIGNAFVDAGRKAVSGPLGFGTVVGENIGLRAPRVRLMQSDMVAYHGSPHDFDAFDSSKIGTGEGAQVYGHGLYFAEDPSVAKSYRTALSDWYPNGVKPKSGSAADRAAAYVASELDSQASYPAGTALQKAQRFLNESDPQKREIIAQLREWSRSNVEWKRGGRVYHVDIPDEAVANMLDWDKPMSLQPEAVKKAVRELVDKAKDDAANPNDLYGTAVWSDRTARRISPEMIDSMDGAAVHAMLEKVYGKTVSDELKSLGIPGIKYLDAGSRGAGDGTRNIVLFDDKLAKIVRKE